MGHVKLTNAVHAGVRDVTAADKDGRPCQQVGKEEACVEGERPGLLVKATLSPDQPGGSADEGIQDRPDDAAVALVWLPSPSWTSSGVVPVFSLSLVLFPENPHFQSCAELHHWPPEQIKC